METAGLGEMRHQPPVIIHPKPGAVPTLVRQYPIPREARQGISPHIHRLLKAGILRKCQSPWNTLLLPVRKSGGGYHPVQDLWAVNARAEDIHPTVPNPYMLLSSLEPR